MRKYSLAQRRAYYAGMGYRHGKEGKEVAVKPENMRSFQNGYKKAAAASAKAPKAAWAKKTKTKTTKSKKK